MTIRVEELPDSDHGEASIENEVVIEKRREKNFRVLGATTPAEAYQAIATHTPEMIGNLLRGQFEIEQTYCNTGRGVYKWEARVPYGLPGESSRRTKPLLIGETALQFDVSGKYVRQNFSDNQVGYGPSDGAGGNDPAPSIGNVIGLNKQSGIPHVEGVEVLTPRLRVHVTKVYVVSAPEVMDVKGMVGKINANSFTLTDSHTGMTISFEPGEALMAGASGGRGQTDGTFMLSVEILFSPNVIDETLLGIPNINARGWDYTWFLFENTADTPFEMIVPKASAAYVAQVYKEVDFVL